MINYHEQEQKEARLRLKDVESELPDFVEEFFRGIAQTTSSRTRLGYGYDLRLFFGFLQKNHAAFHNKTIKEITLQDLEQVQAAQIDAFLEYLSDYTKEDEEVHNGQRGKARKLAAIRSLFKFFYRKEKLPSNPAAIVETPKIHDKAIVRLEANELADLLDAVELGDRLTPRQQKFHEHTRHRDLAIFSLLAGTGMRVSECVGINMEDVDFEQNGVLVTRKGGNQAVLYFGEEVQQALQEYILHRAKIAPPGERALFLSLRHRRITVRSVELLVKKYAQSAVQLKNISPHKLRSTFGTNLYAETGDIYLVADVLGHKDVNTTRKHYAEIEENRRRMAAKYIRLRKEED